MRINWDVVVGSVISGVIVATFSYYFLSRTEISANVSLEYNYGIIGEELVNVGDEYFQGSLKESINRSRSVEPLEENLSFDLLVSEVSNLSLSLSEISRFGAVENLVLTNNNQSREAKLRIRGLDPMLVAWTSKTAGRTVKRGPFEEELVLQPSERLEIRNYTPSPNRWSQDGSDDVLVFADDVLLVAEDRITTLDYMLGPYMKTYPFVFMVLIFSGAIFIAILALNALASVFGGRPEALANEEPSTEKVPPKNEIE